MRRTVLQSFAWSLCALAFWTTPLFAQEEAAAPAGEESTAIFWVMGAGIVALTAVFCAIAIYFDRKRIAKMQGSVHALGGTFRAKPTAEEKQLLAATKWSMSGRGMRNIIELAESDGVRMTLFDFWLPGGKSGSEQTAARIQSAGLNLPAFDLRPETAAMKIASAFGKQDIDIGDAPAFSRMFRLTGDDEGAVRRLFTAELVQFCEKHPTLRIAGSGDSLLFFREHQRARPDQLAAFVAECRQVGSRFIGSAGAARPAT